MARTVELPKVSRGATGQGGLWRVVVLNDNHNTFDHVAESLARVLPEVSLAEGYRFLMAAPVRSYAALEKGLKLAGRA